MTTRNTLNLFPFTLHSASLPGSFPITSFIIVPEGRPEGADDEVKEAGMNRGEWNEPRE